MAETRADGCTTLGSWGVSIKEYYTIEEVSRLLHVHVTRIRELADQADDPMPFRCFEGQRRNGFIYREDLVAWLDRHTVLWRDQR
ncbi:MAG: helix-turn-helix domain-containing protein, partial [Atopobiaceae bacterium]|nr:helix-turn-helix domain-containing protein [Atopobiaceae bacterium]